jgi:hypothetical protein
MMLHMCQAPTLAAVQTIEVANSAIAIDTALSAFGSGSISFTPADTGIGTQDVRIAVTGAPVFIHASFTCNVQAQTDFTTSASFRLVRDSTQLALFAGLQTISSESRTEVLSASLSENPPAGNRTYLLQARRNANSSGGNASSRSLAVLETKK